MEHKFDSLIIGELSMDTNVDYDGATVKAWGGAVLYSGYAAAAMGRRVAVLPKASPADCDLNEVYAKSAGVTVFPLTSARSTAIRNVYHTADRERRTSTLVSTIDPYRVEEVPEVDAAIYHLAGLVGGDIPDEMIPFAADRAMAALDVQCMLRWGVDGQMLYRPWAAQRELLPFIRFLKTDAAEAEFMTGISDRADAARQLFDWGAKEIMITHNTEVLIYDGKQIYTEPIRSRNLSGRTGRGDTTFAGYLNERLYSDIPTALRYAAALVSLKMETPGPFMGARADVDRYIEMFY